MFLDNINIWTSRWSKASWLPPALPRGWAWSNQLKAWVEQQVWVRGNSCLTTWSGTCLFVCFFPSSLWYRLKHRLFIGFKTANFWPRTYNICFPGSQAFGLRLEIHISSAGSPGNQLQILGLLSLRKPWRPNIYLYYKWIYTHTRIYICMYIHTYVCPLLDLFLWRTLTNTQI